MCVCVQSVAESPGHGEWCVCVQESPGHGECVCVCKSLLDTVSVCVCARVSWTR